jgi:transposase
MALFWLSDEAWAAIEPHLPRNQPGARRVDDQRVISGILHVLKAGCRWCDCPAEYGPSRRSTTASTAGRTAASG